jgi:ribulose-bisphosphate carboxylase large chain
VKSMRAAWDSAGRGEEMATALAASAEFRRAAETFGAPRG